jgi:hypothetical protein
VSGYLVEVFIMADSRIIDIGKLLLMLGLLLVSHVLRADSAPLAALPATDGIVYALHVQNGRLYMAGSFTTVGGIDRRGLAAIDIISGTVVMDWDPDLGAGGTGRVVSSAADGKTLYVGGTFVTVGTSPRNLLAAIDVDPDSATYGEARSWNPAISGSAVNALAWSVDGSVIYVGGDYNQVGSDARQDLAAIELTTALATPWAPEPNGPVHSLLADPEGGRLYAGGEFSVIGSNSDGRESRLALAALNTSNAAIQGWNAELAGSVVYDMALSEDGSSLIIAGLFNSAGGQARANLARLDTLTDTDQADLAWVADTDAVVYSLGDVHSGHLFPGGAFTTLDGSGRNYLAMLDAADASVLPWLPLIASVAGSGSVRAQAVDAASNRLFVGGDFADIGGDTSYKNIAAFSIEPPVTVSDSDGGFASQIPLTVTLTCTDQNNAACAATYYTLDESTPTTAPPTLIYGGAIALSATTTLKYFSIDFDGNREAVHSEFYSIDVDAPLTTASPGLSVLNSITYEPVELVCSDGAGGSGCAMTYYSLDGSTPAIPYTAPIQLTNAVTTVKYFSVDQADNSEVEKSSTYTLDTELPTISVSHPWGNYSPPLTVTVICDDGAGSGCDELYLVTDGSIPTETSSPISYSGPIDITLDSASILRVQASDLAGNSGESIIGIYTFTRPDVLSSSSSGTGSLLWLPVLLLPLLLRQYRHG